MYRSTDGTVNDFGPSDLAGLELLGYGPASPNAETPISKFRSSRSGWASPVRPWLLPPHRRGTQ
jgi:hypothetical protein